LPSFTPLICSRHIRPFEDAHKRAPEAHHQARQLIGDRPMAEGRAHHVAALEGVERVGLAAQAPAHQGEGILADLMGLVLDGAIDHRHLRLDHKQALGHLVGRVCLLSSVHGVHPFL
jgi:hypothetical protein